MSDLTGKRARRTTSFDYAAGTVTLDAVAYSIAGLPDEARKHFMLHGFSIFLLGANDPVRALEDVVAGRREVGRSPATPKLDDWREAAAIEMAIAQAGATRGAIYDEALAHFRRAAPHLTRDQMAELKINPKVVARHARLTGGATDLLDFLAKLPQPADADPAGTLPQEHP